MQPHGTNARYVTNKCRCVECRSAHAYYERSRKQGKSPEERLTLLAVKNRRAQLTVTDKRKKVAAIKIERGCVDCGFSDSPAALDFDHRPGAVKLAPVSRLMSRSWETILAEIDKCDVRCATCHRIATEVRRFQ